MSLFIFITVFISSYIQYVVTTVRIVDVVKLLECYSFITFSNNLTI